MVSGSQALEKVWLFSVPLHLMLLLWKHILYFLNFSNIWHETYFNNNFTCLLCIYLQFNITSM